MTHIIQKKSSALRPTEFVQRPDTLFKPLVSRDPEVLAILHDIGQNCATKEHHVFPTRWILDLDLEFLSGNKYECLIHEGTVR